MPVLRADQFPIAFDFARCEAADVRGPDGSVRTAPADVPRFDHDAAGQPRGLLVTDADRAAIDPLMLPADLTESASLSAREATVYHLFVPIEAGLTASSPEAFEAAMVRRAYFTRDAAGLIDSLLASPGHHVAIGTHAGFAQNRGGFARYRGKLWQLASS